MVTTIKFLKKKSFKNAVLFTGLPGIGLVGKICVDYLLKQFNAEKVAEIYSDSFPPSVQTTKGVIDLIKDEIFYYSYKGKDFLFLAGPVQPILDPKIGSMQEHYEFAKTLVSEFKAMGVTEICTLAGINIGERRMHVVPRVVVAATSKKSLESWVSLGAVSDKPVGMISGAAGLFLGIGKEEGLEGACLMGETNARLIYGDPGAAKTVLELIIKRFGFSVEMKKMEQESKEIEKAFSQLNEQLEDQEDSPPSGLTYVR
ncbi:MAG TPA: PAC2 family protein [archaeon]|nr:PAC2 family protein [archaeon]